MNSKKKRIFGTIAAVILILVLGLAGTFAASGSDQSDGSIEEILETKMFLHDDFGPDWDGDVRDRDIYIENTGDTSVYLRIRLDEFMEYGGRVIVGTGGNRNDTSKWKPHLPSGHDVTTCATDIHEYFTLHMGNSSQIPYKSNVKNWYEGKPAKDRTAPAASVMTLKSYMELKEEERPVNCWLLDSDGYAYWYTRLGKEKATGLLLNGIENTGLVDESYYYGINAKAEAVTESDLNAWFYGTTPTSGINTEVDRATNLAVQFLKDLSPKYIRITETMNQTDPKASAFDKDGDGYLTVKEYGEYLKEAGTVDQNAVEISKTVFPDDAFRKYIEENLDTDKNKQLTPNEIAAVNELNIAGQGIKELTGIGKFYKLVDLDCSNNKLIKLDVSGNKVLSTVKAGGQQALITVSYQSDKGVHQTKDGAFGNGTTFGNSAVSLNEKEAAEVSGYTDGMKSSFTTPLTFGKTRGTSELSGEVEFQARTVEVSAKNFPDSEFLKSAQELDIDGSGILTDDELDAVTTLDISNKDISNLTGMEAFLNLQELDVSGNHLTKPDLSKHKMLTSVNAGGQTTTVELEYDDVNTIYKSKSGLFGEGTTFGKNGVTYNSGTGAAYVGTDITDQQFDSTYETPLNLGEEKAAGKLAGTVTFTKNQVLIDVKQKNTGETVTIKNDTSNHPYGETTDWIILSKTEEEAVLITKNMVTTRQFHPSGPYPTWPKSDIRAWLNGEQIPNGGTDYKGKGYIDTLGTDLKEVLKAESLKTPIAYNNWVEKDMTVSADKIYFLTETGKDNEKTGINPGDNGSLITTSQLKCPETADDGTTANYWWLRNPRYLSSDSTSRVSNVFCLAGNYGAAYIGYVKGVRPAVTVSLK